VHQQALRSGETDFRLAPGSHASPREGMCIVELTSILAGEEFSDHPDCVCPVIGAYLRSWNDRASHVDRQRLIPYADRIVGSRADAQTTRLRRDICLRWTGADLSRGPLARGAARSGMRLRIGFLLGIGAAIRLNRGAATYAARIAVTRYEADAALRLLEELLEAGGGSDDLVNRSRNGNGDEVRRALETAIRGPHNGNGNGNGNGHGHVPADGNGHVPADGNGHATNGNGHAAEASEKALV